MLRLITCILVVAAFAGSLAAEDKKPTDRQKETGKPDPNPNPNAAAERNFHISRMIIKQTDPIEHFIYGEGETDREGMMDFLQKTFFGLMELEGKDGAVFDYPPIFIYQGADQDPKKKFKLATGFPVRAETKPVGDFKIKKIEGIRCASIYYTGSLEHFAQAYDSLYTQLSKAGHKPTGETRELYLFWAGETSPNTVVEIQAAIAPEEKK